MFKESKHTTEHKTETASVCLSFINERGRLFHLLGYQRISDNVYYINYFKK